MNLNDTFDHIRYRLKWPLTMAYIAGVEYAKLGAQDAPRSFSTITCWRSHASQELYYQQGVLDGQMQWLTPEAWYVSVKERSI